jgi:hypothetical protein
LNPTDFNSAKVHLLSMNPGERFTLSKFPGATVYTVAPSADDRFSVLDPSGSTLRLSEVAGLNGGSCFVHPAPSPKGGGG